MTMAASCLDSENGMTILRAIMAASAIAFISVLSPASLEADPSALYKNQNIPPKIVRVGAVLFNHVLYVVGKVEDPDDNPQGQTVYIGGSVQGTTVIGADGMFYFRIPYSYPHGTVTVHTFDRRGAESYTETVDFFE